MPRWRLTSAARYSAAVPPNASTAASGRTAAVPGVGTMMAQLSSRQCGRGASHRKNFDTPPPTGRCRATKVARERWKAICDLRACAGCLATPARSSWRPRDV